MRLSTQIKPISYVKAHASELLDQIEEEREPIITQNGEAKAVLMDVSSFDQMQETRALLKLLAMAEKEIEAGETFSADEILAEFRKETARR
ncbi:MAG: type II toxin-antitoxin system Phd/YefM family antitoxin [Terracidiphilus sp.]